jgi:hypothetical protein
MLSRLRRPAPRPALWMVTFTLVVIGAGACGSSSGEHRGSSTAPPPSASKLAPIRTPYEPTINPSNFVAKVDNELWPLEPGTHFHYKGVRGKIPQTDDEVVTNQRRRILGIRCTVVRDTVSEHGHAVERTLDFYAPGQARKRLVPRRGLLRAEEWPLR